VAQQPEAHREAGEPKLPRSMVYNIFRKFQKDGVCEAIWEELHVPLREQRGRQTSPTAAVIDSQTLKAAEKGAGLMVMTPGRRSMGARFMPLSTPKGCRCGPSFIPRASRTAMARRLSSIKSVTVFPGSNWSGRTMATTRGKSQPPSPKFRCCASKSSSAAMTRKVLSSVEWATAIGRAFLDHLEAVWREPDEGIWEVRGPRQHSSRAASGSSTI
jgi:hypothetical protein